MSDKFKIEFVDRNGPPTQKPNPDYPNGIDLDASGGNKSCTVALPYPAEERGKWIIECRSCGYRVGVTAAGRRDDPRSIKIPCRNVLMMQ